MSTIQTFSVAPGSSVSASKVVWSESKSHETRSERPRRTDAEMMYAWSIGVTDVARKMTEERHEAECPPEVYIG